MGCSNSKSVTVNPVVKASVKEESKVEEKKNEPSPWDEDYTEVKVP